MNSVLVTGHKGLLGSACIRRLITSYRVLIYYDNLLDEQKFRKWMDSNRPDYVIHCAAKVGGVKSNQDNPAEFLEANLRTELSVIVASKDFGVKRLVFVGTSCLFPKDARVPVKEESILSGPFEPAVQAYAIAKLAGYELCRAFNHQLGTNFITVCPSNLYGPGDNYGPSAHVIPALISRLSSSIRNHQPLTVWGDGSAVREFLYVDDAADAIATVLSHPNPPDLINIGTGQGTTISKLVDLMVWISGSGVRVEWDSSKPTGIQNKTFDIIKIRSLGWEPKTSLADGLDKTWHNFHTTKQRMK